MSQPHVILLAIEALTVGGAERVVVDLATHLPRERWQPHVLCLSQPGELAAQLPGDVPLHCLHKKRGLDFPLIKRIRTLVQEIQPALINTHLWTANTWLRAALPAGAPPIIVTEHNRDVWKRAYHRWIDRRLANRMRTMIAVSEDAAAFYRDTVGIAPEKLQIIHNGIDTARYRAGERWRVRSEFSIPDEAPVLGMIGRLVPQKNPLLLLDAFAQIHQTHPQAVCLIAGGGPLRAALLARIAELKLERAVFLTGSRGDVPDLLAAMDVFALSSDREGHPLTALEAQAAGVPVVLTDVGGNARAIAKEGNNAGGQLVPARNPQALAQAVCQLFDNSALRKQMGDFARKYAQDAFDIQQTVRHYDELFLAHMQPSERER